MLRSHPLIPSSLAFCATALLAHTAVEAQTIPAFPGAEGAGAYAKGGRGGDVYHVTNTNTSGVGSFAYGLTTGVPAAGRTIVFDVSGYVTLSSVLRVTASKITVAGQTAPGDGFGIKGNTFRISGDDIVIRHFRFRAGHTADAINLDSGSLNCILDHCDTLFSGDENFSSFDSPPENQTFQWGLNAWGREPHSCGGLWDQNHATCHHSLWSHNHTRNPKARPLALDWTNNVTFDFDIGFIMGDSETPANWNANVRGNYFICPPGNVRSRVLEKANLDRNGQPNFSIYVQNNLFDKDGDTLLNGIDYGFGIASGSFNQLAAPVANNGVPVAIDNPLTAYKKIVSAAGPLRLDSDASKPLRDEVAGILVGNLVSLRRNHITRVSDTGASNGGFGTLSSAAAPSDGDRDGMPDYYENALGWNAASDDHNTALPSSGGNVTGTTFFPANTPAGYTRLEEYLHFLAIPHGTVAKNVAGSPTSLQINLQKFTAGFTAAPAFTVANIVGGTVAQSGAGNSIVTFTPTLNYTGRARFEFTVTDFQGSSWTQTVGIVVTASGLPRDLIWKGDNNANAWDYAAANWTRAGAAVAFSGGDFATFNDSGSKTPAINVNTVSASGVVVDAAGNYTFAGSGSIAGPLTKRGPGTLTISNTGANSLAPATLEEGTLSLPSGSGLGSGVLTSFGGTLLLGISPATALAVVGDTRLNVGGAQTLSGAITGAGTLSLGITGSNTVTLAGNLSGFGGVLSAGASSGFLRLNSSSSANTGSAAATFDLGIGSTTLLNRNGNLTIDFGALQGGPGTSLSGAGSSNTATTYRIGANGADTTFAGTIANGSGSTAITKTGPGTLILSGANTYTGATNVSAGTLVVAGSLGSTATSVASGAVLAGGGALAGPVTAAAGSIISPGTAPSTGEAITFANAVNLSGCTIYCDLSNSPAGANDRMVMNGGALAFSGTQYFQFLLLQGALSAGTYNLVTGASTSAGTASFTHNLPTGTRQIFNLALAGSPPIVRLTVTGDPATLTWTGAASATWDTATANNWVGATPNTFVANDAVIFNDTSLVNGISVPAAVSPRSVTFNNNSRAYTISGGDSTLPAIVGPGALVKTGAGALILAGVNSFSGGTTIGSGSIITLANDNANAGALGTGVITLNGGTVTMFDGSSTFNSATFHLRVPAGQAGFVNADSRCDIYGTLDGGGTINFRAPWVRTTLFSDWSEFTGTLNVITDADGGDLRMGTSYSFPGFPQATVNLADKVRAYYTGTLANGAGTTIEIGELSGAALSVLHGGATGGRNFIYRIGGKTPVGSEVTFAGTIQEQNSETTTSFVKTGAGTWRLSGTCNWNGGTAVEQGTLRISGAVANGAATRVEAGASILLSGGTLQTDAVEIASSATLTGSGSIKGDVNNAGTVQCASGTLTITGDVVNAGTMRITGRANFVVNGSFVNNGLLDVLTAGSALPGNLVNNGVVVDSSSLSQAQVSRVGTTVTVTCRSHAGHTYQLQRADSLSSPTWTDVGSAQAGDGSVKSFQDSATGTQRFYRVVVSP